MPSYVIEKMFKRGASVEDIKFQKRMEELERQADEKSLFVSIDEDYGCDDPTCPCHDEGGF